MPDGTTRFKARGKDILHFMGTSTFSQYTVVADISVVAVTPKIATDRACLLGCGITTGYGAAVETAKVEEGSNVAVFGVGCVGLSVVQGAVRNKAGMIIAVDVNDGKEAWARKFGATHFVNPTKLEGKTIQEHLIEMTDGGCDYTFDCTGNVGVMRAALEACHKGWGESIVIGVAAAGQEISTRRKFFPPFFLTFLPSSLSPLFHVYTLDFELGIIFSPGDWRCFPFLSLPSPRLHAIDNFPTLTLHSLFSSIPTGHRSCVEGMRLRWHQGSHPIARPGGRLPGRQAQG